MYQKYLASLLSPSFSNAYTNNVYLYWPLQHVCANSAVHKLVIVSYFFPEKGIWNFMQIVSMKCQILFSEKKKKKSKCCLLKFLPSMLSIKLWYSSQLSKALLSSDGMDAKIALGLPSRHLSWRDLSARCGQNWWFWSSIIDQRHIWLIHSRIQVL